MLMKKLIISLALIALAFGAQAQNNVIKTNPLGLAFGNFNATYERVLGTSSSILIRGQYMYKIFGLKVGLGGVGLGYRYYITHAKKPVPSGFYVNPQAVYSFGSMDDIFDESVSISTIGLGAELGYQWAWPSGFVLDLGLGPMYTIVLGDNSDIELVSGIGPTATLAIGYAF